MVHGTNNITFSELRVYLKQQKYGSQLFKITYSTKVYSSPSQGGHCAYPQNTKYVRFILCLGEVHSPLGRNILSFCKATCQLERWVSFDGFPFLLKAWELSQVQR